MREYRAARVEIVSHRRVCLRSCDKAEVALGIRRDTGTKVRGQG